MSQKVKHLVRSFALALKAETDGEVISITLSPKAYDAFFLGMGPMLVRGELKTSHRVGIVMNFDGMSVLVERK